MNTLHLIVSITTISTVYRTNKILFNTQQSMINNLINNFCLGRLIKLRHTLNMQTFYNCYMLHAIKLHMGLS